MKLYLLIALFTGVSALYGQTTLTVYNTIADLKAIDVTSATTYPTNTVSKVLGYYNANDGGGGDFRFLRSTGGPLSADNGGTIIAPNSPYDTYGRWIRICEPGFVNVLWFGAKPTPTISATPVDSLSYIQNAYNSLPALNASQTSELGVVAHVGTLYFPFINYPTSDDSTGTSISSTTYWTSDTLVVGERITLKGDGPSRVGICLLPNMATTGNEKFVIYFARSRDPGMPTGPWSANITFDTGVEGLGISAGQSGTTGGNPMSSGVFMDAAQMSFIRNCWLNYFGLRCIVGAPYTIENITCGGCRGPALDLSFAPKASDETTSMAAGGDGKVHATNIFVGPVGGSALSWPTDEDGEYYPAVRLRDCNMFVCADLRVEGCPKVLKAKNCGSVTVASINTVNNWGTAPAATTEISLNTVGIASFKSILASSGSSTYTEIVHDKMPGTYMGPMDMKFPADISAWERCSTGQTIFTSGGTGPRIYGSGANYPFRVVAKPNDGGANQASYEGNYIAEFYKGVFSGSLPLEDPTSRVLGIRKDGQIETPTGVGLVTLGGLGTMLVQPPISSSTFNIPALAVRAIYSGVVTMPTGTVLRPGDIVTASLARSGFVTGAGGPALPTGVYLRDATVTATNQVTLRFVNDGAATSALTNGVQYKVTVAKDSR